MKTRLGIELTPTACRILAIEGGRSWRPGVRDPHVRSCAVLRRGDALPSSLRGQSASVVVWGAPNEHRQVMVDDGSYESMRAEARVALDALGLDTHHSWCDITPAGVHRGERRRPVLVTAAVADAMRSAIRPLIEAGVRVRAVMTPAAALAAIARSRRSISAPGAVEAYIALDESMTCIAVTRGGLLTAARDIAWGYASQRPSSAGEIDRGAVVARLGDELVRFFDALGEPGSALAQICVCGNAPDLRGTTPPLMERFDVAVETLDSLCGIDVARLPADVQERAAEWRMAWAAAAEWPPATNLLRQQRRNQSQVWLRRAAVFAGAAAGLGAGVLVARKTPPPTRMVNLESSRHRSPTPVRTPAAPEIVVARAVPPIRHEPPAHVRHEPPVIRREPASAAPTAMSAATGIPPVQEQPLPKAFDAVLETVLFSADRQLAIVDGRVVGKGDGVKGATVVDITAGAVLLRDSEGRLRRLTGQ